MIVASVHAAAECIDVDPKIRADGHPDQFDIEIVRGLGEGRMRALGRNDSGVRDPPFVARHVPGRLDRLQEAFRAARCEVSLDGPAARRVVRAEQCGCVLHDVVLHDADAGEGKHIQTVFGTVER